MSCVDLCLLNCFGFEIERLCVKNASMAESVTAEAYFLKGTFHSACLQPDAQRTHGLHVLRTGPRMFLADLVA